MISIVDADTFWVDAYFEETQLASVREGDPAEIKLMGYREIVRGEVGGVARAINVPNADSNHQGVANVNPIFTRVRLAQRVPVRIQLDQVPDGARLVAGMTATALSDQFFGSCLAVVTSGHEQPVPPFQQAAWVCACCAQRRRPAVALTKPLRRHRGVATSISTAISDGFTLQCFHDSPHHAPSSPQPQEILPVRQIA